MLSRLQMLCLAKEQQIQRGLGTHWQHDPAVLEDALGNRIRLPLEMIKSWEVSVCCHILCCSEYLWDLID
jgi:phage gp36-like protein